MTAPIHDWIDILQNAAKVKSDSPDYADAQQAIHDAVGHIQSINRTGNEKDQQDLAPSKTGAAISGVLQGASMGLGEPLSGLAGVVTGKGFTKGAQDYRDAYDTIAGEHPWITAGGETAGSLVIPAAGGSAAFKGVKAGVPLTAKAAGKIIASGAVKAAVPGAIQGFSSGGKDAGDTEGRFSDAAQNALISSLLGAASAGASIPSARRSAEGAADLVKSANERRITAANADRAEANAARSKARIEPAKAPAKAGAWEKPAQGSFPPINGTDWPTAKADAAALTVPEIRKAANTLGRAKQALRQQSAPAVAQEAADVAGAVGGPDAPPSDLDIPTYQRRGTASGVGLDFRKTADNPLILTAEEQAVNRGAKAERSNARTAARSAYVVADAGGQPQEASVQAARRAAAMSSGPPVGAESVNSLRKEIETARAFGNSDELIAKQLAKRGISPAEVHAAMGTSPAEAAVND